MSRIVPHPYLTIALMLLWLLLAGSWTLGSVLMALILGLALPVLTASWWPDRARLRDYPAFLRYIALALWDIVVANVQVARIILFMPADQIRSAFITVPLDLRAPEAVAILASTITLTPGTVTCDTSACGRALLIHALHAPDPDAVRDDIKQRYEARLLRIFGEAVG